MTHFIKLLKSWEDNKYGDVVEVGKSTAHALVMDKIGERASDPAKFPASVWKKKSKKKNGSKKKLWGN